MSSIVRSMFVLLLGLGMVLWVLGPSLWTEEAGVQAREMASEEASLASIADVAIELLERVLSRIVTEAERGEFSDGQELRSRLEAILGDVTPFLLEAAGDVAEEELAEVEEFLPRLRQALEDRDLARVRSIAELIRRELEEIREALSRTAGAGVEVEIGSAEVGAGERVTVPLKVERLEVPLGAYSFTVRFDPAVVQAREVTIGYGTALPAPLIDNDRGTVRVQGIEPTNPQAGDLVIAELTFEAVGSPGSETELELSVEELADPDGDPIEVGAVEDGHIAVR